MAVEQALQQAGAVLDQGAGAAAGMILGNPTGDAEDNRDTEPAPGSLAETFATIQDPRRKHLRVYPLQSEARKVRAA